MPKTLVVFFIACVWTIVPVSQAAESGDATDIRVIDTLDPWRPLPENLGAAFRQMDRQAIRGLLRTGSPGQGRHGRHRLLHHQRRRQDLGTANVRLRSPPTQRRRPIRLQQFGDAAAQRPGPHLAFCHARPASLPRQRERGSRRRLLRGWGRLLASRRTGHGLPRAADHRRRH